MYRFFTALFVLACLMVSGVALADEKVCNTPEDAVVAAHKADKDAIVGKVDAEVAADIMSRLVKQGIPEAPFDEMVLIKWPNGNATIILYEKGCATKMGTFPQQLLGREA